MNALSACMHVHPVCAWCPRKSEEAFGFPGTEVTDSCKSPLGCWELNPSPLQE